MILVTVAALNRYRKRLRPPRLWRGLISDPVDQAKLVAFSVEGKAKSEALPQALFGASD